MRENVEDTYFTEFIYLAKNYHLYRQTRVRIRDPEEELSLNPAFVPTYLRQLAHS